MQRSSVFHDDRTTSVWTFDLGSGAAAGTHARLDAALVVGGPHRARVGRLVRRKSCHHRRYLLFTPPVCEAAARAGGGCAGERAATDRANTTAGANATVGAKTPAHTRTRTHACVAHRVSRSRVRV